MSLAVPYPPWSLFSRLPRNLARWRTTGSPGPGTGGSSPSPAVRSAGCSTRRSFPAEPTGSWSAPDGTVEIDTRYSARTADGEYVHFRTSGVRSGPPAVLAALLRGEPVDPSRYYFRLAVHLETAAPRLAVLERSLFIASAVRGADSVSYTAYRVT